MFLFCSYSNVTGSGWLSIAGIEFGCGELYGAASPAMPGRDGLNKLVCGSLTGLCRGPSNEASGVAMVESRSERVMRDFLDSQRMDRAAEYAQRGRKYRPLGDDELIAKWLA